MIANLALYFATNTLFARSSQHAWGPIQLDLPDLTTLQPGAALIGAAAMVMIFKLRWSVLRTLGACALLGLVSGLAL